MTKIEFDVPAMLTGGGRLEALGESLGGLAGEVAGISLAGLPPDVMGVAQGRLGRVQGDLRTAGLDTATAGSSVLGKAARVLILDGGGDIGGLPFGGTVKGWPGGAKGKGQADSPLDRILAALALPLTVAGQLESARAVGRKWVTETKGDLRKASRKIARALDYYAKYPWVRRMYASPEDLRQSGAGLRNRINVINRRTRILDAVDLNRRLPPVLRNSRLGRSVPLLGSALAFGGALAEGRSVPDAAGKTVATTIGGGLGAAGGSAACGAVTIGTGGLAAATCPTLIFGGGALGGFVADKAYDPVIKPVGKFVIQAPGKIVGLVKGIG